MPPLCRAAFLTFLALLPATGPWEQLPPLLSNDSGHGMLFTTFEGQLMLVIHRPFKNARGKLYEVSDNGHSLSLSKHRTDLDQDPE